MGLFCVSKGVLSTVEREGARGGGIGGGESNIDRFERMQKIEGRQRV